jgi:hypothetical protein
VLGQFGRVTPNHLHNILPKGVEPYKEKFEEFLNLDKKRGYLHTG